MFRIEKQINDEQGPHRWSRVPGQHATRSDAERAMREAALASLTPPHPEGYRSTTFRVVPVLAAAMACRVLQ